MTIARIEDGHVVEQRELALDDVPAHKRGSWRPVHGDPPDVDRSLYTITGPSHVIEDDCVRRVWQVTPRDLAIVKAETKARISAAAEAERGKYLTLGSGKAMTYQELASEAKRHLATDGAGEYPFLATRVASGRYRDLVAARDATLAIAAQWTVIGAAIDEIEDRAKLRLDAATTVEEVLAAAEVAWPCPG